MGKQNPNSKLTQNIKCEVTCLRKKVNSCQHGLIMVNRWSDWRKSEKR